MNYILLLLGLFLLIKGADAFVDGASSIAKVLRIPSIIIGLTIVSFGTSAPEAAVSITASINGQNGMAIGNIIGSNIFNLLMVVGFSGFIKTLSVEKSMTHKEFPFLLLSSILMFVLSCDILFQGNSNNLISRGDGIVLLMFFAIFMYSLISYALRFRNNSISEEVSLSSDTVTLKSEVSGKEDVKTISMTKSLVMSVFGVISIVAGGHLVVTSASIIASSFGVSDQFIGLTIVAIGTSLPEFVTSVIAATKGEADIALGNVIGSNIFNILFILGISAAISPIVVDPAIFKDALLMILVTSITYIFAFRKRDINKFESSFLIVLYIVYMCNLVLTA